MSIDWSTVDLLAAEALVGQWGKALPAVSELFTMVALATAHMQQRRGDANEARRWATIKLTVLERLLVDSGMPDDHEHMMSAMMTRLAFRAIWGDSPEGSLLHVGRIREWARGLASSVDVESVRADLNAVDHQRRRNALRIQQVAKLMQRYYRATGESPEAWGVSLLALAAGG